MQLVPMAVSYSPFLVVSTDGSAALQWNNGNVQTFMVFMRFSSDQGFADRIFFYIAD